MAEGKFEVVRNANPSLVKEAQALTEIAFGGENESGYVIEGKIIQKKNIKSIPRREVEPYDPKKDNARQLATDPFSADIKTKNDLARVQIIPLLNPMAQSDGIRLNSIALEIDQDIATENKREKPDIKKIEALKVQQTAVSDIINIGNRGREGIVFKKGDDKKK